MGILLEPMPECQSDEETMIMYKIIYFADTKHPLKREEDIYDAMVKMGHKVVMVDESDFDMKLVIKEANKADLFFFHTGGVTITDSFNFHLTMARLATLLQNIKCKKVFWFFNKVIGMHESYIENIAPIVSHGFLNDETWLRRNKYDNLHPMHLAWGRGEKPKGKYKKELDQDIVFMGSVYNARLPFMEDMKKVFGDKFKLYNDKYGQEFADMCESAKIIVSPAAPFEEFFWSDRVYRTMANGGFLLHPRLEGLKEEFEGKPVLDTYGSWEELADKITFWLKPENKDKRKSIAQEGAKFVSERFGYDERLKAIFNIIK